VVDKAELFSYLVPNEIRPFAPKSVSSSRLSAARAWAWNLWFAAGTTKAWRGAGRAKCPGLAGRDLSCLWAITAPC